MESLDLRVLGDAMAWRRAGHGERGELPSMIAYGVSKEEAARFGLSCGGTLRLVQEPVRDIAWIERLLARTAAHELVARTLTLATGEVVLARAERDDRMHFDGLKLTTLFGPKWRLLLIGAGQLSQAVAQIDHGPDRVECKNGAASAMASPAKAAAPVQ